LGFNPNIYDQIEIAVTSTAGSTTLATVVVYQLPATDDSELYFKMGLHTPSGGDSEWPLATHVMRWMAAMASYSGQRKGVVLSHANATETGRDALFTTSNQFTRVMQHVPARVRPNCPGWKIMARGYDTHAYLSGTGTLRVEVPATGDHVDLTFPDESAYTGDWVEADLDLSILPPIMSGYTLHVSLKATHTVYLADLAIIER
jgi:hypothetical protein